MYYKPMGDLLTSALNRAWAYNAYSDYIRIYQASYTYTRGGGLIIHHGIIYALYGHSRSEKR